jgi:hypothetical protein
VGPIVDLFNDMACYASPLTWSQHIMHSLHKPIDISDPYHYQTILIGHTLDKFYATAIDMHFSPSNLWILNTFYWKKFQASSVFKILMVAIMRLDETAVGNYCTAQNLLDYINSTIGVKQNSITQKWQGRRVVWRP